LHGNCLRWELADACRLPFPDASFNHVLCVEAMFHFASRRTFFAEAARVLSPRRHGGVRYCRPASTKQLEAPGSASRPRSARVSDLGRTSGRGADHRALGEAAA